MCLHVETRATDKAAHRYCAVVVVAAVVVVVLVVVVGCWLLLLLVVGCWLLLVVGCSWLLLLVVVGCWLLLVVGCWLLVVVGCWLLLHFMGFPEHQIKPSLSFACRAFGSGHWIAPCLSSAAVCFHLLCG